MQSRVAQWVAALAAHHGDAEVVGIQFGDRAEVEIVGTAERMTVAEFARRYPAGVIIQWYGADEDDESPSGGLRNG